MSEPATGGAPASGKHELRRDVTVWSSFMWGYADVGADVYVALGLVIAVTHGAAPLAFCVAGLAYLLVGFAYTELASAYPVGGAGQYFAVRGLGDFWGYVAGAALLLNYTVDIALFAVASAGYLNFLWPYVYGQPYLAQPLQLGPLTIADPLLAGEALALVAVLLALNVRGVKESSLFSSVLGAIDIAIEASIIVFGFIFAWRPALLAVQWHEALATLSFHTLAYGSSLAMVAFIGLESISHAAQETRRPATIIPRTAITIIFTVFIFVLAFSTLSLGVLRWELVAAGSSAPVALLARSLPFAGVIAGPVAAVVGMAMLAVSANSGILSASRLTFSMSRLGLVSPWLDHVHPRSRTPVRAIVLFTLVGALEIALSAFSQDMLGTLAHLYVFGATLGYILLFLSLIGLRFSDPYTPRQFHMPLNLPWRRKDGATSRLPLLALVGLGGVTAIFVEVATSHPITRIAGPAWMAAALVYYFVDRRGRGLPFFGSRSRDWEKEQLETLTAADEPDLVEQYKSALLARDRARP